MYVKNDWELGVKRKSRCTIGEGEEEGETRHGSGNWLSYRTFWRCLVVGKLDTTNGKVEFSLFFHFKSLLRHITFLE